MESAKRRLAFPSDEDINIGYGSSFHELLRAIDDVMPDGAILYVEGTSIAPAIEGFLRAREHRDPQDVELGTWWPKPRTFHLPLAGTNLEELRELAEAHASPEVGDHLVVYQDSNVLLWAHDAGYGYVLLSRSFPADAVERFKATLGPSLRSS